MSTYTTQYVKNLSTGEPFILEVDDEVISRLELQKKRVKAGKSSPMLGRSVEELTKTYEFSFFPAFNEVLQIFIEDGFTTELITKILKDFGVSEPFIQKLLEDEDFISQVKPWFSGITSDGGRAVRTLAVVYNSAKSYFSPTGKSEWGFF